MNGEGYREILGICEGAKEDKAGWSAFLKHLKERGLNSVRLIISDACLGLAESAAEFFPDAVWQRCVVHWYRNIFSHVPATKVREIAAMLKAIHASEDIVAAREKAVRVIEKLRDTAPDQSRRARGERGRRDADLLCLPRGALAENPHQQPARAHPARDQAAHPCGRCISGWAIGSQSCSGQATLHRRYRVVDQEILEHRIDEGPADERCHHRLSQCRASLSPKQMCEKLWTLPNAMT